MPDETEKLEKIRELKQNGQFEDAYTQIKTLYQKMKNSPEIKNTFIDILFAYGFYLSEDLVMQYQKAADCFQKIIELDPRNYRAYYNLGITYYDMDMPEKALEMYRKAIQLKSDNKFVHYNMGLVFEETGRFQKALKAYNRALKIDKHFIYARQAKRILEMKLEQSPELIKSSQDDQKISRLKSLFRVSTKVKIDDIQQILDLPRSKVLELIVDWAEEYGFHVEGELLVLNDNNKAAFLENLRKIEFD
jgi:tetratricopeptide (TPR) repeat protein